MLPYWAMFLLIAAGASIERPRINIIQQMTPFLAFVGVVMALMIGLRFQVGGDWFTYVDMLRLVERRNLENALEWGDPGYQFTNWVATRLGTEIWSVNLVCGVIFVWGLVRLARNQPSPMLAIAVAVPYMTVVVAMGYTRQAAAIGFIMAGLASVERGSGAVRFAIYVAFAAMFHKTAIIMLPIVMFTGKRNYLLNIVAGLLITMGLYSAFLADSMDKFVENYVDARYSSQGAAIRVAMNVLPALLMLMQGQRLMLGENQYRLWRLMAIISLLLIPALLLTPSSTAVDRLALYVLPIQLVVLPRAIFLFSDPAVGRALILAYCAIILFVWLNFANHASAWRDYRLYPIGGESNHRPSRVR